MFGSYWPLNFIRPRLPWKVDLSPRILAACFLSFSPRAAVPSLQSPRGKLKWVPAMSWWWLLPVAYVVVGLEIPSWCMPCMARCLSCPWRRADDPSRSFMEELGKGDIYWGEQHSRWSSVCRERSGRFCQTNHRTTCLWFRENWPLSCRRSSASSSYIKDHDEPRMNPRNNLLLSLSWTARCFIEGLQVKGFWCDVEGDQRECRILDCRNCMKMLWTLGNQASIFLPFGGPERPFTGVPKWESLKKR